MYYILLVFFFIIISITISLIKGEEFIKKNKNYLLITFIILLLFVGLRGQKIGLDAQQYKDFFIVIKKTNFITLLQMNYFEPGFKYLAKIISLFTKNYSVYIFIISTISIIGFYEFIKEYSKNYFLSIFLFITFNFYIYLFCTIRQTVAISIILISLKYLLKDSKIKYFSLIILASLFHKTALVFIPVYILKKIDIRKIGIKKISIIFTVLFAARKYIIMLFTYVFYKSYENVVISGDGYFLLIILISLFIMLYIFIKDKKNDSKENILFYNIFSMSIFFQILATAQGYINRISLYFMIPIIVLIPNIIEQMDKKIKKRITYIIIVAFLIFFIYNVIFNAMYVEYHTILWRQK